MGNKANMAGKQLRPDISRDTQLSNEYACGDGRAAIDVIRNIINAGFSRETHLETMQMSPYIGAESGRFMDGGLSGRSIDSPVVMGVGRSDLTINVKGQRKEVDGGTPQSHAATGVIEQPMSPETVGVSEFMDHALGGYSVNHSPFGDIKGSDPAICTKVRGTAMGRKLELPDPIAEIPLEPMSPYLEGATERSMDGLLSGHPLDHPKEAGTGRSSGAVSTKGQGMDVGVGSAKFPVHHDDSVTLFVEGLPVNCTAREVSHIFRPFVGFKELRLVKRRQKHPGAGALVFCFVDFTSQKHAVAAKVALQGYLFDEYDRNSARLKVEFARNSGARFGGAHNEKC